MDIVAVLQDIKKVLEEANNDDLLVDTLWMAHGRGEETLFDYIDQQIENAQLESYSQKDIKATEGVLANSKGEEFTLDQWWVEELRNASITQPMSANLVRACGIAVALTEAALRSKAVSLDTVHLLMQLDAEKSNTEDQAAMKVKARQQRNQMTRHLMALQKAVGQLLEKKEFEPKLVAEIAHLIQPGTRIPPLEGE